MNHKKVAWSQTHFFFSVFKITQYSHRQPARAQTANGPVFGNQKRMFMPGISVNQPVLLRV
jgi:hypothetical protein